MDKNNKSVKKIKADEIEWKGIDGFLISIFFIVCAVIWISIIKKIDAIIGYAIPILLAIIVTAIFIAYLREIYKFSKK
ncbi:hypothetical protein [Clostridium ljungdahlii]|uniref:Uncharacterized protein n=1 Tax=Clostridium ljungdahlii TaxID=1538 RepID=A0A170NLB8_9CLOT|nr:hypothetical protein [Clostridium ljungdahlii]OAA92187.1 hypothetical protein WY13_00276 [Clostridium ljungdahlii]